MMNRVWVLGEGSGFIICCVVNCARYIDCVGTYIMGLLWCCCLSILVLQIPL